MKENTQLEPGLLRTYRLLSWVLVGISAFQAISLYLRVDFTNMAIHPLLIFPFGNFLILILLYWPWIRKKTGKFFIPMLVLLATVGGIVHTYLTSLIRFNPDITISILVEGNQNLAIPFDTFEFSLVMASWQMIPLLFIPLIMVAWQYDFKAVIANVVGATLLDIAVFFTIMNNTQAFVAVISFVGLLVTRTLTYLVVGFLVSRMMAAQRKHREALRYANRQLLGYSLTLEKLTISRERNRLARELHDTLAHTLSSLAVQLGAIKALWMRDNPHAKIKLDEAIQVTRTGLNETRRALQALRAAPLEDLGLCLALKQLAQNASDRCGASLSLTLPEACLDLPTDISQAFYRAAQEAIENIVRHANAQHITLNLINYDHNLTLEIVDDGVGFDSTQISDDNYGLKGLIERAERINGSCDIISQPSGGTKIIFRSEGAGHD